MATYLKMISRINGAREYPAIQVDMEPFKTRTLVTATFQLAAYIAEMMESREQIRDVIRVQGCTGQIWLETELSTNEQAKDFLYEAADAYANYNNIPSHRYAVIFLDHPPRTWGGKKVDKQP